MVTFWKHVMHVIKDSDIIIEVLDARYIEETKNKEIERVVKEHKKRLLYVINKIDLVEKKPFFKGRPSVYISSKDRLGTTILKKKILEMSRGEEVVVGVVGYPNVGKSSLINALSGKGKARTSSESGFTKGKQKIRVDAKIVILDTPGVFSGMEQDIAKFGKTGAISYAKIKDPEMAALKLIKDHKKELEEHYSIVSENPEDFLEKLAFKFGKLAKGGVADLEVVARLLLKEWQVGKIIIK